MRARRPDRTGRDEKEGKKAVANVVSICGSLRRGSYNRMLMQSLPALAPAGMSIAEAPPFASFPLYNADIQGADRFPGPLTALSDSIGAAYCFIFCTP